MEYFGHVQFPGRDWLEKVGLGKCSDEGIGAAWPTLLLPALVDPEVGHPPGSTLMSSQPFITLTIISDQASLHCRVDICCVNLSKKNSAINLVLQNRA